MTERFFTTWDGTRLFFRAWLPDAPPKRALVLFHRGHEHSGRFEDLVRCLGLMDFAVFAWDARGHGKSPGERGCEERAFSGSPARSTAFPWKIWLCWRTAWAR